MSTLQLRFEQFIAEQHLCQPNRHRILIGLSGGKDSVLLLHLLLQAGYEVGVAHCNFQLRGEEADQDEELARTYAEALQLPFHVRRFQTESYAQAKRLSIQMAARDLRYQWFKELSEEFGYDRIAVAHHATDNIETILINQLRGTGIRGLVGMDAKNGMLIRPMLFMSAEEVAAEIEQRKLIYRDDESNFSTYYWRNKLRLDVVPILRSMNPDLENTFAKNSQVARDLQDFLEAQTVRFKELYVKSHGSMNELDLKPFVEQPSNKIILHELLHEYGFGGTQFTMIWKTLTQSTTANSGQQFFSATYQLLLDRHKAIIRPLIGEKKASDPLNAAQLHIKTLPVRSADEAMAIVRLYADDSNYAVFDADRVQLPVKIRQWEEGDYFRPFGMNGQQKKLSDFFTQLKLSRWEKEKVPLLVDREDTIIWVIPHRVSSDYNISNGTKNVMVISYFCQNG